MSGKHQQLIRLLTGRSHRNITTSPNREQAKTRKIYGTGETSNGATKDIMSTNKNVKDASKPPPNQIDNGENSPGKNEKSVLKTNDGTSETNGGKITSNDILSINKTKEDASKPRSTPPKNGEKPPGKNDMPQNKDV